MDSHEEPGARRSPRVLALLATVGAILLGVGALTNWYSREVSLPRYCENPDQTLRYLERIMHEQQPAGGAERRPYLIAAKLLFLLPREAGEDEVSYLERVGLVLRSQC